MTRRTAEFLKEMKSTLRFAALSLLLFTPSPLHAQQGERSVRAAFVFHLTKYVEWSDPGDGLIIGFAGDDYMGETLRNLLDGKGSDGRKLRVVISPLENDLQKCNVVYLAYRARAKNRSVLSKLQGKNVLTVGETEDFVRDGGMVGLVRNADQIQIQVNLNAAQSAGLNSAPGF
jgi:YfiR/HmsC-like